MRHYYIILLTLITWSCLGQSRISIDSLALLNPPKLYSQTLSNDGEWMSYLWHYQTQVDTTVIISTSNQNKSFKISGKNWGRFSDNSKWYISNSSTKNLLMINLENGLQLIENDVVSYKLTFDENFIVILKKSENINRSILKVINLTTKDSYLLEDFKEYVIHPNINSITYIREINSSEYLYTLDLEKKLHSILYKTPNDVLNLNWSKNGDDLVFVERNNNNNYELVKYNGHVFIRLLSSMIPQEYILSSKNILISDDGKIVYFKVQERDVSITSETDGIEVWLTSDKSIFPNKKNKPQKTEFYWYWLPETNKVYEIENKIYSNSIIRTDAKYVLKYNPLLYEPNYKLRKTNDIYIQSLTDNSTKIIVEEIFMPEFFISPNSRFILFIKDGNWMSFDTESLTYINYTQQLSESFIDYNNDREEYRTAFGDLNNKIAWSDNYQYFYIMDEFDVWMFSFDGEERKKITDGAENNIKFRIINDVNSFGYFRPYVTNHTEGILLKAKIDEFNTGLFLYKNEVLQKIIFEESLVDSYRFNHDYSTVIYMVQQSNVPPQIIMNKNNENFTLVDSCEKYIQRNEQYRLLNYYSTDNIETNAGLLYPHNYNPEKSYPLIVFIYEKNTRDFNYYNPLGWFDEIGFNPAHYTYNDYFVLLPDIHYEIGNPGLSALKYVEKAVTEALKVANIDKGRLGLIGHSYGGYETSFIVTQTDMFAGAVAGAPIIDMVNFYHTINWNTGLEEMWRFEDSQMRMNQSFFANKEGYYSNSPFHHVENLSTPLMLWVGKNDFHINFNESIRMYLAMRRLGKKGQLLVFENEEHSIINLNNQIKLGEEIMQWFDKTLN